VSRTPPATKPEEDDAIAPRFRSPDGEAGLLIGDELAPGRQKRVVRRYTIYCDLERT